MSKKHKKVTLASIIAVMLCCGSLAFTAPAEACCVYNHTTHPLVVDGSGIHWTIAPSNKDCTNGTGGKVQLYLLDAFRELKISYIIDIEVDDHGWISVYRKSGGKCKVVSKRKDGSIKDVKYLKPAKDHSGASLF